MIYYEILEDGSIGRYTNSEKIAELRGWAGSTGKTEEEFLQEIRQEPLQTEQSHEYIDPNILDLAEAVLELSAKVEQLEGVAKQ